MKIAVVGAGAMGGTYGGRLALAGHEVTRVREPDIDYAALERRARAGEL
jgi:ketopantoate reductase